MLRKIFAVFGLLIVCVLIYGIGRGFHDIKLNSAIGRDKYSFIENSQKVTLYSIYPSGTSGDLEAARRIYKNLAIPPAQGTFHYYPILGKVVLKSQQKQEVSAAFLQSIREGDKHYSCFEPRHALRFERDGKTLDAVLCFSCSNVSFSEKKEGSLGQRIPISWASKEVFNSILKEANVFLYPDELSTMNF